MLHEAPLQNSAVQGVGLSSPALSPPSSQVTSATPPGSPFTINTSDTDENSFFHNKTYKKHYFQLFKVLSRQVKSSSRIWFLKHCLKLNLLPPTSIIKANHNVRFSDKASDVFSENLRKTSFENLKLGIEEEKKFVDTCKLDFHRLKLSLHSVISEANLHIYIESRLKIDSVRLNKQFHNVHKTKLCFLLKKDARPIPSFLSSQTENPSVGPKKPRRFVKRTVYRRKVKQLNKKQNCLVTNYSDIVLTKDMESLLNRGLNFAITPKSVNTTDIHAGFKRLERSMKWGEVLHKNDDIQDDPTDVQTFQKKPWRPLKTNLPKTANSEDLTTFLNGSLACVLGSDLNKIHTNLPEKERRALKELTDLQKERVITCKPHDKTGGTAVLNTGDYINSMETLLTSKFSNPDGSEQPYFQKLDPNQADQMQFNDLDRLKSEVSKAKAAGWIDKDIASWLVPGEHSPGRLYGLVKDHVSPDKWPEGSTIPPLRPVESASGTTFENASHFVDLHSNDLVKELDSYWEDTGDMLRCFERENEKGPQPPGTIPVTLDVSSLYTNIPIAQGIKIFESFLNMRSDKSVPTSFLIILLTLVLTCNILVFNNEYYLQLIGTAMGTRVAPTFACLFMGHIEKFMLKSWKGLLPRLFKRYIDDIFFLWSGNEQDLKKFINHLNNFHPYLKFKANYNFETKSVEFLDTVISISSENFIKTTLFVKPGKKCTYLLPSSCHANFITLNIPYSLSLRLKRICSDHTDFLNQLDILKENLMSRGYKCNYILKAFDKVVNIERSVALQKTQKKIVNRPVLPLQYDPRLPNITNILFRFWKVMIQNPVLKSTFPQAPMVCWKRPKNLREHLIRAKLPKQITVRKSSRQKLGFKHCQSKCVMCDFSPKFINSVVSSVTNFKVPILSDLNCKSKNVIYCITCTKTERPCAGQKSQYIGETSRSICERLREHKDSIKEDAITSVGKHFSENGHDRCNLQIVPFEQIRSSNPWIRKSREKHYIRKFNSILNKRF